MKHANSLWSKVLKLSKNIKVRGVSRKILVVGVVILLISVLASGSVLAYSLKLKQVGDTEYKNGNYISALASYQKARFYWIPERLTSKLKDRDLEIKIGKAEIMIRSNQNFLDGIREFDSANYDSAKYYLTRVAEKDSNRNLAISKLDEIEEIKKNIAKTNTTQKNTQSQLPSSTKNSPQIDCVGPDGKQFRTTELECQNLNTAWKKATYMELNREYITASGLTVRLTNISKTEESGSYKYTFSYTQENKTADKKIDEGYLIMVFEDGSTQMQYGFFNTLFPGDSKSNSYTFQVLKFQKPKSIEFSDNSGTNISWRIDN